jgi:hypothetical protein
LNGITAFEAERNTGLGQWSFRCISNYRCPSESQGCHRKKGKEAE